MVAGSDDQHLKLDKCVALDRMTKTTKYAGRGAMSEQVAKVRDQHSIDSDHIRLLSIFHFVSVGFAVLGMLFLAGHYAIFQAFFANPEMFADSKQGLPPPEFFAIFKWFYVVFGVWYFISGILNLASGLFMRARKHRTFSLVVAGLNCLHIPLGTILGIFTFIVLSRESVLDQYEASQLGI